jgi:hypothetical protein
MSNTYTWKIDSLDCFPSLENQKNVVSNIHWRVNGNDGTNFATVYGTQSIAYTDKSQFIDYESLTEDSVISWLKNAMGNEQVSTIQSSLDSQISVLANPPIVTPPLPWGNK